MVSSLGFIFILALAAPLLGRIAPRWIGWATALPMLAVTCYFAYLAPRAAAGDPVREDIPWAPALDISLTFHLDGLGLLFALLITGIGALILIYAGGYLRGHRHIGRFFACMLAFAASMLGLVLADNVVALSIFWELTSLSSFFLIGFDHRDAEARQAAWTALIMTAAGGLAMLAGLILLAMASGAWSITEIIAGGGVEADDPRVMAAAGLILLGIFTKSAQVPFHFWLPGAMVAVTPVSAYLHSATMVKAGVYLAARLSPVFGGMPLWNGSLMLVGALTVVIGAILTLSSRDMKTVLAYLTVSGLGLMILLLGIGTEKAVAAAVVFMLAHAFYKGSLFMTAGAIDHETGTRSMAKLGGLGRRMRFVAATAMLGALCLAGIGPVLAFMAKEEAAAATLGSSHPWLLTGALVVSSSAFLALALELVIRPFCGSLTPAAEKARHPPPSLWVPAAILAAAGVAAAWAPGFIESFVAKPAARSVLTGEPEIHLALWKGVTPELGVSGGAAILGAAAFLMLARLRSAMERAAGILAWGPSRWYRHGIDGLTELAGIVTRALQTGYLPHYLLWIVGATIVLPLAALGFDEVTFPSGIGEPAKAHEILVAAAAVVGAVTASAAKSRLQAVAALSVTGSCVALLFLFGGAPDLAMTQFLVESLLVILFALVLFRTPKLGTLSRLPTTLRDVFASAAAGAVLGLIVWMIMTSPEPRKIGTWYTEHSLTEAKARNIVNAILVDFRAFDTLGEISVLAIAAAGVIALLKRRPERSKKNEPSS